MLLQGIAADSIAIIYHSVAEAGCYLRYGVRQVIDIGIAIADKKDFDLFLRKCGYSQSYGSKEDKELLHKVKITDEVIYVYDKR
jgi:hypothetical protein